MFHRVALVVLEGLVVLAFAAVAAAGLVTFPMTAEIAPFFADMPARIAAAQLVVARQRR